MSKPDLMTTREVCDRLGISTSTLSRWVAAGELQPVKKGRGLRGAFIFARADVEEAHKRQGTAA